MSLYPTPNSKVVDRTFTNRDPLDQLDYDSSMVVDIAYDSGMRETHREHGNSPLTRRLYDRQEHRVPNRSTPNLCAYAFHP